MRLLALSLPILLNESIACGILEKLQVPNG